MATTKGKPQAEFKKVVQLPLTQEMAEEVVTYSAKKPELMAHLMDLANKGYAVSFKPNFKPEGVSVSCMPALASLPNAGLMIYANAPTAEEALAVLILKLDFLTLTSDWLTEAGQNQVTRYS